MRDTELRFRQIHLDFHTSEHIVGIGSQFDPDEFANTLAEADVDSITCFARCHHGWIYFDTQAFPERRHPHLTRNLLKDQIDACHARDIRVPIYITVQWDHYTANRHPEWLVLDENGAPTQTPLYEAGFYRRLCVNSPYTQFLKDHVKEVMETLPVDGIFFDIVAPQDCSCMYCQAAMTGEGLDPADPIVRREYGVRLVDDFKRDMSAYVHAFNSDCTIFYNAGHVGPSVRPTADAYTHFELESLPSGGWGYLHFPMTIRYARNLGIDCMGMTGKFHTSWGDFHSFKNAAALDFECFQMLAQGAKCSIGDQLHPLGAIDPHVYDLIGSVYSAVKRKESWCRGARPITEIGVFTPEEFCGADVGRLPPALMGITRMLEEGAHQFDIIDSNSDLSPYRLLVLPDEIPVSDRFAAQIERYVLDGGAVIASFESGLDGAKDAFALKSLGVELGTPGSRDRRGRLVRGLNYPRGDYTEYLMPQGAIGQGLHATEYAMYMKGLDVRSRPGTEVLAQVVSSYFDRTYQHFCSHRQTPSSGQAVSPAIVRNGRAIYFSHPVFRQYNQNAPLWCKHLFLNAMSLLLPDPLLQHDGPSTLRVTVNDQPAENRWVVHILHYIPERRGQDFDVIEDVIPVYNVKVSVRAPAEVRQVTCVPEMDPLTFDQRDGRVVFVVPEVRGHQMVALTLE
ncbi:MAG: beta-galactosidase [Chloroflexi bacterium]|nr:beta-galactosidase [Chloroflexota bacterium]